MQFLLMAALGIAASAMAWAGTAEGVVKAGAEPLEGIAVIGRVQDSAGERHFVSTQTGSDGRYRFEDLPGGRLFLRVGAPGYFTLSIGGVRTEELARSCPADGDCGTIDIELQRAEALDGRLRDGFDEPVVGTSLALRPADMYPEADPKDQRRNSSYATTDDRGYFRFWGLRPGRYVLETNETRGRRDYPSFEIEPVEVEVGDASGSLQLSARRRGITSYRIQGVVEGLEPNGPRRFVIVEPERNRRDRGYAQLDKEGRFETRVAGGRYVFRMVSGRDDIEVLDVIDVQADMPNLRLRRGRNTRLEGVIRWKSSPADRFGLQLRHAANGEPERGLNIDRETGAFHLDGLAPSRYEITCFCTEAYLVAPVEFEMALGQTERLEIEMSTEFATVRGRVRTESQTPGPLLVKLRGDRGEMSIQTDPDSRFVFERVIPGDYELAAALGTDVDLEDESMWQGAAVRRFTVEAGFEVELEVTAAR